MVAAGSLVCGRTSRIMFLALFMGFVSLLGCREAAPAPEVEPPAPVEDVAKKPQPPEELFLRRFVAVVRARDEEAYQAMWHPDVRHHVDIEILFQRYPKQLEELVRRIEAALDGGASIETEALEPTDRGNARRKMRYRCIDRALEERDCALRMLTDFGGRWFLQDVD